jgi:aminobenzoyl-glutamate utilization protein B
MAQRNLEKVGGVKLTNAEKSYIEELYRNAKLPAPDFSKFEEVKPFQEVISSLGGSSDDTGDVSQVVPLCRVETCLGAIHTWHFSSISGTSIATKAMLNAAKTIFLTFVEIYKNPKELKKIHEEWEAVQGKEYKYECLIGNEPPALEYYRNIAKKVNK